MLFSCISFKYWHYCEVCQPFYYYYCLLLCHQLLLTEHLGFCVCQPLVDMIEVNDAMHPVEWLDVMASDVAPALQAIMTLSCMYILLVGSYYREMSARLQ